MCRLLVFKGVEPIQLSNLVTKPAHSIINQAFDARLRLDATRSVNGDGFGLGWYDVEDAARECSSSSAAAATSSSSSSPLLSGPKEPNPQAPCIFTSVTPAWNNQNLQRLCEKIRSPLVFAHIRASTSGALSETNCHPWRFGRLMWMHNGQLSQFPLLKRTLLSSLDDNLLNFPQGQTDSEWAFALFLSHLERPERAEPFDWKELKQAMDQTIRDLNRWAKERGIKEPSLMNFCVTDGVSILCTRYVSSLHDEAASLYFSSGTSFYEREKGRFRMRKEDRRQNIVVVASEPLTFEKADWMEVPTNTMIIVTPKMNVLQIPILDEYSPIDRPHPTRAPLQSSCSTASGSLSSVDRRLADVPASVAATASGHRYAADTIKGRTSRLTIDTITANAGVDEVAHSDARGRPQDATEAPPSHTRGNSARHRSPTFALHAGFPPNGHIGVNSNAAAVAAAAAAAAAATLHKSGNNNGNPNEGRMSAMTAAPVH